MASRGGGGSGVPLYLQGKGRGKGKGRGRPITREQEKVAAAPAAPSVPASSSGSATGRSSGAHAQAGNSGRSRTRTRERGRGRRSGGVGVPEELSAMTVSCTSTTTVDDVVAGGPDRETGRNTICAPAARPAHNPEPWPPVGWDPNPLRTAITSATNGGTTLSENAGEINTLESTAANLARKGLWADAARAQVAAIEVVQRAQRMAGAGDVTEWTVPFEQNLAVCRARARVHDPPASAPRDRDTSNNPAGGGGGVGRGGRGRRAPTAASAAEPPAPAGHATYVEDAYDDDDDDDDDDEFLKHALELSAQLSMAGTPPPAAEAGPASTPPPGGGRGFNGGRGSTDLTLLAEYGAPEDEGADDSDYDAKQLALVLRRSMLSYAEESNQPS